MSSQYDKMGRLNPDPEPSLRSNKDLTSLNPPSAALYVASKESQPDFVHPFLLPQSNKQTH